MTIIDCGNPEGDLVKFAEYLTKLRAAGRGGWGSRQPVEKL